jgi:quinohemoprotein ethanol dehydrogenase
MHSKPTFILRLLSCALLVGTALAAKPDPSALADEADARNWTSYGRTYNESHFSPLTEISHATVSRLRLAWALNLDLVGTTQSTPLAVDGVIYVAAGYSILHAVDARTGKILWRVDTGALTLASEKLRAGAGIRGLAYRRGPFVIATADGKRRAAGPANQGQLFVGTHDGRLVALDAATGGILWSKQILGLDRTYISGAPRICGERVLIGFGAGAGEHARGFVTARDVISGEELWRWYAVPSDQWSGGAVWNTIVCDPSVNRVYVGTGEIRRQPAAIAGQMPDAGSVVALDAVKGTAVWVHRDDAAAPAGPFGLSTDASFDVTLATLPIDGAPRRVLLHAPKDGWFYVIDRDTGKRLSARKLDTGIHTLAPQAFSPKSGLVYLPTASFTPPAPGTFAAADAASSHLVGWDPVKQTTRWAQPTPGSQSGGALATAGDLVFQGQADGYFVGWSHEGKKLWQFYAASAALGTPISFAIGPKQYVAILVGPPVGTAANLGAPSARFGWDSRLHPRRLLAFTLDGTGQLPPTPPPAPAQPLDGPDIDVDETLVKGGAERFAACQWCHGAGAISGGMAPDLRASTVPLDAAKFSTIVKGGVEPRGMPKFEELTDRDLEALRHFIRARARAETRPGGVAPPPPPPPPEDNKAADESAEDSQKPPPGSLQSEGVPPPQ